MHQIVEQPEYRIKWKKWRDPFDVKDNGLPEEFHAAKDTFRPLNEFQGNFLVGPAGIIPFHEGNRPSVLFNFWRADTNFRITNKMVDLLAWVDGVESFTPMTPYRFRISIGKLFDEETVLKSIDEKLLQHLKKRNTNHQIPDLDKWKAILNAKYKYWAIIIQNTGKQFFFGDNELSTVKDKIGLFKKVHNDINQVICSWE